MINNLDSLKEEFDSVYAKSYFNFLITGSWIENNVKGALKSYGLTHAQLNALHILVMNHPNSMPANELKGKILVSNPDVTRLLDRLVKKGYVAREVCQDNRRQLDITVTDSGIDLFYKVHVVVKNAVGNFFEKQLTKDEAKELRRILHKIRE